jgi:GTPase SAR1 family protein
MLFKITVLGEGGVGKTALTVQVSFGMMSRGVIPNVVVMEVVRHR